MPICPSGSQPRSGIPAFLAIVGSALEFLITRRAPWLAPFLIALQPFNIDTTAFCAEEPPDFPTWEPSDLLGLLSGQTSQKLTDTIRHVAWYEFCECSGAATPAAPFLPPPSVLPVVQPETVSTCDTAHYEQTTFDWFQGFADPVTGVPVNPRQLPVGVTSLKLIYTCLLTTPGDLSSATATVYWYDSAGATAGFNAIAIGSPTIGESAEGTFTVPSNATQWLGKTSTSSSQSDPWRAAVDTHFYCGGVPDRLAPACCPPDPTLVAKIDAVLELVTLVQRQGVPFAYVPGLTYTGLSGSGNVTFTDPIIRLQVDLTSLPGWYGLAEGDPDRLFDIGFVSVGTADGYEPPRRITHTPFLLPVGGDVTKIGYELGPGVVATIRTFSREP